MKTPFALALGALIGGNAALSAQNPDFPPVPKVAPTPIPAPVATPVPTTVTTPFPTTVETYVTGPETIYYPVEEVASRRSVTASAEAMSWWLKPAPLSIPTLTTFRPGSPSEITGNGGVIGVPGTIVLSPDQFNYGGAFAGRVSLGVKLDDFISIEANGFVTDTQTSRFSFMSKPSGLPQVRVPFINPSPNEAAINGFPLGESSFVLSDVFIDGSPFASGGQVITSKSQLWGLEANAVSHRTSVMNANVSFLAGVRYIDLAENLSIYSTESVVPFPGFPGGRFVATDAFGTRNQFYGGQIGVRADSFYSAFFLTAEAKLALGWNHETLNISGFSTSSAPGTPQFGTGGIFTGVSNIGRYTSNEITVVPSLQLKTGANVTQRVKAFVGYDLLFLSDVIRPGNQLDRTVNLAPNNVANNFPVANDGPARPFPLFSHSDFWAQGVSFGIEVRY